jgi:hypothetical protein
METLRAAPEPEIVAEVPKQRSNRKYPWESWTDGQARKFTQGVHFQTSPKRFAAAARRHAEEHGLGTHVRILGEAVYLRFLPHPVRGKRVAP